MIKTEIIRLVKSLSGSEKRHFKLFCKKQSDPKDYMDLFDIINNEPLLSDPKSISLRFKKKHPGKSFESTAHYLLKLVTDSLIQIAMGNDMRFQQYFSLMRSQVLFERSISEEGFKELKKAQRLATNLQDNLIQFHAYRQELNYFSEIGFPQITENELVDIQMKAKKNLRQLHQNQEHSSLFELLKYRLIHSGRSLSDKDKEKLNDLLISELSLITRGSPHNFETQKAHLLFQSFFLTYIGKYQSSLQSFIELNKLFENNESKWGFPPYDYLYALEGILDNLRSMAYYDEIDFFLKRIERILEQQYPEHFQTIARQTIYIYKLNVFISKAEHTRAVSLVRSIPVTLLKNENPINYEKRAELLFHIALAFFCTEDFKEANKHLGNIKALGKVKANSSVYRASWLIHILLHYELDNLSYLDYEIRSYKRTYKKSGKALEIERLIFKLIKHDPKRKNKLKNSLLWNRIETDLTKIGESTYERQILKYYDFLSWIKNKIVPSQNN